EVGSPLFRRGRRGMVLTEAGRAFLPYADRAVRALQDGSSAIERLPLADELVLGAAPAISTYVLPQLLVRFEAAHPAVRLSVRTAGPPPRGVLELDHIDAAKQMVLAGLGVALLPTTAVASELRSGSLRRVELIGTPRIERRIAALRRLDAEGRSPAQVAFWSL